MNILCKLGLHSMRDVGPPKETIDSAFKNGGFGILGLVMLAGRYMCCERCGHENEALMKSGGMAARFHDAEMDVAKR